MISKIDVLLSKYVERHILDHLGPNAVKKIKNRLAEKGYSLTESIKLFYPFDEALREFFADGTDGMLQKIFRDIYEKKNNSKNTIVVKDRNFASLILETYGDKDKKSILQAVTGSSMSISDILEKANIPKSSGYKIINSLVDDGFLSVSDEKIKNPDGNKVFAYAPTISSADIKIQNSLITIEIRFFGDDFRKSRILALSSSGKRSKS